MSDGALRAPLHAAARLPLSIKLVVATAVLTAVAVGLTFAALGAQARRSTSRLLVEQLLDNQRAILSMQRRSFTELLWTLTVTTESPTLRAAMETYRVEAAGPDRAALITTIQRELDRIMSRLGRDLLLLTDERGRVLASSPPDMGSAGGVEAAMLPSVRAALALDSVPTQPGAGAVARLGTRHYQVASVPIIQRGFAIGTLTLGERLEDTFLERLRDLFAGQVVVAAGGTVVSSTLPDSAARALTRTSTALSAETVRLGAEDFVVAGFTLGTNESGQPVMLYLLRSLSQALAGESATLRRTFLLYGSLAVTLAALAGALLSRSLLTPLNEFVGFMRSVAARGAYGQRFEAPRPTAELATLADSYNHLIASLARERLELEHRTRELSLANASLTQQMTERERAEEALKESEAQLRQSQKLEALGTLAGGVAHDFNNLLTVITGYADLVASDTQPDERTRADIDQIKQAAGRAAALTQQLLAFGRKQVMQPRVLDLNSVIAGLEQMLRRLIGEHLELSTIKRAPLPRIKADPGQIGQVVMNLVVNARDAMPRGGRITLETADVHLEEPWTGPHGVIRPGHWVSLSVTDAGIGMDAATLARIFEPFFTTKEPGKGTGLGLSTVYGIVKQSGGSLWVDSEPGLGTTFKVFLPPAAEVDEREGEAEVTPLPRGTETVLLVEDEAGLRNLARRALESAGYRVITAGDGVEALESVRAENGILHLLLTDVIMPRMSGRDLAAALSAERPDLRVLFMSGYTDDVIARHGVLEAGTNLLQKPFTTDRLVRRVREVLDTGGSAA